MVNWTMLPFMSDIWSKLQTEILPKCPKGERTLFIDLADPEKRTREDIAGALKIISGFESSMKVILGLNLKESTEIAEVLGIGIAGDAEKEIEETAKAIRQKLGISCVVIHPRQGAAAATAKEAATICGAVCAAAEDQHGGGGSFQRGVLSGEDSGVEFGREFVRGGGDERVLCADGDEPDWGTNC